MSQHTALDEGRTCVKALYPKRPALAVGRFFVAAVALGGCGSAADRELGMFVRGDIANARVIAEAARLDAMSRCLDRLEPVAMATPDPRTDGILVLGTRALALELAVYGPCGSVLAPILLRALGKASGPFGVALPF